MKSILIKILFLTTLNGFSQILGDQKINSNNLTPWSNDNLEEYVGSYSFGFSEGETELRIVITDSVICAQLVSYVWKNNLKGFIPVFENFENVKIVKNKFYSDKSNGKFVIYNHKKGHSVGLLIEQPWNNWLEPNQTEFGQRFPDEKIYLNGKYPEASTQLLNYINLKKIKPIELKIMRNEIFARYGYKFISEGKMDKHFRKFDWYTPVYESVDHFLTSIENKNIAVIKKVELKNGL